MPSLSQLLMGGGFVLLAACIPALVTWLIARSGRAKLAAETEKARADTAKALADVELARASALAAVEAARAASDNAHTEKFLHIYSTVLEDNKQMRGEIAQIVQNEHESQTRRHERDNKLQVQLLELQAEQRQNSARIKQLEAELIEARGETAALRDKIVELQAENHRLNLDLGVATARYEESRGIGPIPAIATTTVTTTTGTSVTTPVAEEKP